MSPLLRCTPALLSAALLYGAPAAAERPTTLPVGSYLGEGAARIVGGNVVSARRRALRRAQQAALVKAAGGVKGGTPEKLRALPAHLPRLLHTYRVLSEGRDTGRYQIALSARFDLPTLRKLLGAPRVAAPSSAGRVTVALFGGASGDARTLLPLLRGRISAALGGLGIELGVLALNAKGAVTAAPLARAVLGLKVEVGGAAGVRGLGLEGAWARVSLELGSRRGEVWLARRVKAWGRAKTAPGARRDASQRALRGALKPILGVLRTRVAPTRTRAGRALLTLRGVQTFARFALIRAALERAGLAAGLRRLFGSSATLDISAQQREAVAKLLTTRRFRDFSLVREAEERGGVVLRLQMSPSVPGE